MKHLGLICVFSSHDIVSYLGGDVIGKVGDGSGQIPHQFSQFKLLSQAGRFFFLIKCSYLYTTNLNFVVQFEILFFSKPLNV